MRTNDVLNREEARAFMQKALADNNPEDFAEAMNQMMRCVEEDIGREYDKKLEQARLDHDQKVLSSRGARQLTSTEKQYYQKLGEAINAPDPKQALANLDVVMPETVIDSVFEDLRTDHPLLSHLQFMSTNGAIKMLMNTNGRQEAQWGPLCGEIVKELLGGFKEVDTGLLKLSAFLPVCKAMLDLGPTWLDNFVRQVLYEALANGLEAGVISGDGNDKPIGMNRQVGEQVSVTGGVYPEKNKIQVSDFSAATIGNLLSLLAVDPNGNGRTLEDVILIVNPQDYFQKVMPATTLLSPDGSFRNDVLPYPISIIQSAALKSGDAILGMGNRYFAAAGMEKDGRIEFSDQYQFLEDNRVYLIKLYANGFPLDNNAFLSLDISTLRPITYKVEQVTPEPPSTVTTLADLRVGSISLSPAFSADTKAYTAATKNATNTVSVMPSDAGALVQIKVKGPGENQAFTLENGSAATWFEGANTVTVLVTAADGKTTETYTVTVTKGE